MLETRARVMNNDIIRIDLLVSSALDVAPPVDRVARAENFVEDGTIDAEGTRIMGEISKLIAEFGFPVVMSIGMGYFIWYVWKFITGEVKPALGRMFTASIKLTDRLEC